MRDKATRNLYPQVTNWDEKYGSFDKDGNKVSIDESAVDEEVKKLQDAYDAKEYQRDRIYPEVTDQLDMIYWDKKNSTDLWKEAIDKVKSDNPKP